MHFVVEYSDLQSLKETLQRSVPNAKPSHRMEAMAKGFGFSTYASLLAALKVGPISVAVDEVVFCSSLGALFQQPGRILSRAISRAMLQRVLYEYPNLTQRGFDSVWQGSDTERRKSIEERKAMLIERRHEAATSEWSVDQFELALVYLSQQKKIKSINRKMTSYGLKHRAENLSRDFGMFNYLGNYVSNGMLIAAAIAAGFRVQQVSYNDHNAYLNISTRTVKTSRGDSRLGVGSREVVQAMYGDTPFP